MMSMNLPPGFEAGTFLPVGTDDSTEIQIVGKLAEPVTVQLTPEQTAVIKGINTYKVDKNIKLATYASRCISNEILMYIRKNKKGNVVFYINLDKD